ncbi:MAG: GtrA family protein [Candidatus Saccharibacteria bacterium]|nr:GtrA family protein [Candidatus Saccharibacteria bacterium]
MNSNPRTESSKSDQDSLTKNPKDTKTSTHAVRFFFVGVSVTLFNYALYAILANLIIRNNDLLWLSNLIATSVTTIVAYLAHSKITWKERQVTKASIIRFFIWNALLALLISPGLTQLFSLFTPVYDLAYNISSAIHLPFTYEFVLTTGAFVLTTIVIMILNFLFYDKFVFPKTPHKS